MSGATSGATIGRGPPGQPAAVAELALLPPQETLLHALGWLVVGLLGLLLQVLLVRAAGPACVVVGLGALALLYRQLPLAGLMVLWQVVLFQNLAISLFADGLDPGGFQVLLGLGFMATGLLGAMAAAGQLLSPAATSAEAQPRRVAGLACLAILVAVAYAAFGATLHPAASVATYFRATTAMLMMLLIGLDVGRIWDYRTVATGFLLSVLVGFGFTWCEMLDPARVYEATGALPFMNLKYGPSEPDWPFLTAADLVATRTSVLFNVTGSESGSLSFRFGGPNIHPISYAYVVAMAGIAAVSLRQRWVLLAVLPLLLLAGVKGALIMFVTTLAFTLLWEATRSRRLLLWGMAAFTLVYVAGVIKFGLEKGDFHVIGLLGGVKGLLRVPLGHGIGAGGNLSADGKSGIDWIELQHSGADFALESAVGVLLYQLGIGCLALAWAFAATVAAARTQGEPAGTGPRPTDVVFIAVTMTIVNGIFQEEAYSPYALGTAMLLAGVAIGNGPSHAGNRPA